MAKLKEERISIYLPRGFVTALRAIASMTGEGTSGLAKRILADGIKSEASAVLVMNKLLAYGLANDKFPPGVVQELATLDSDRRNLDNSDLDSDPDN